MKQYRKRCAALALVLAIALTMAQPAGASWALGEEITERTVELGTGTALTTQSLWSASKSDLRTEHYVTYTPNDIVKPVIFSGTYVASTNTVESAAAQLEEQGLRVAAALNGGFFNTDGTIVGMLMTEGTLRALDVDNYSLLGFTQDGQVFIDESKPSAAASWTAVETVIDPVTGVVLSSSETARNFPIVGFNAYRNSNFLGGLYLYSPDFSSRVTSHGPCVSVILRPLEEGGLKMNGALTLEAVSVNDATQEGAVFDGTVPEGCFMLYGEDHDNPELLAALRGLAPGTRVTVSITGAGERWADAAYGVSGRYTLLRGGQIVDGLPATPNPYTAVGVKEDGSAVFYTIDGRQSGWSVGATYAQVAQRLQELGCVSAVALDGGGSTVLGATIPGGEGFEVVNRPSTAGRRINNTIALVSQAGADILSPGAYVSAEHRVVLAGARLPLSASAYDSAGRPAGQQALAWTATGGAVMDEAGAEDNGPVYVYTAGTIPGTYSVSAGGGALPVEVVDKLFALTVSRKDTLTRVTTLELGPGDQVELMAAGSWWNLPVAMGAEDVAWAADPAVGVIDETGVFTAGTSNAEGLVTVSAGGITVEIPVRVDRGDPFTDIAGHWCESYVTQLYRLGLTNGQVLADGSVGYVPNGSLTRTELLAFVTRLLGVNPTPYEVVELPFADQDSIEDWAVPYIKAMYTLKVIQGSEGPDGRLYANANDYITREEAMTILGRVLAVSQPCDLSAFADAAAVSDWARPHVQTLVALNVVGGSGGLLSPGAYIDRAAIAKLLVEVYPLDKALLIPRLDLMS